VRSKPGRARPPASRAERSAPAHARARLKRVPRRPAAGAKPERKPPLAGAGTRRARRFTAPDPVRVRAVIEQLRELYPDAKCALDFRSPLELLIATILSAQCTDERVNKVTPALFAAYRDAAAFAAADPAALEKAIHSTGFFRNKAKSIREASADIVAKHGGQVPRTLEELTALRGVGRKTANVVLGNAYGIPGLVVDTHVTRLSHRLGLTNETDPVKIELDLNGIVPPEERGALSLRLILHGRRVCKARKPQCDVCVLNDICPSAFKV
jgi:endonuclease-3